MLYESPQNPLEGKSIYSIVVINQFNSERYILIQNEIYVTLG